LEAVGAMSYADAPVGRLSGGEQQRLRVAQSVVGDPILLLADEPLLSLDLNHAAAVSALFDDCRRRTGAAVLFVTHDVNPVLPYADRVLYLANETFRIGSPAEVMTSHTLSELYGSPVEVLRSNGRLLVAGGAAPSEHPHAPEDVS
ncbi:MAG: ATP-binding cassette domain-containing protein, partial [Janthinobacterium lividum]